MTKVLYCGTIILRNKTILNATKEDTTMKNVKKMTYKELTNKVIENNTIIRSTKDLDLKRKLIVENHEMMTEMDRRWNSK